MKIAKKFKVIFVIVLCYFLSLGNNVNADTWTLSNNPLPVGYRFQYGTYYGQNYLYTDDFILTNEHGERRETYCIQQRVLTAAGAKYNETVFSNDSSYFNSISELADYGLSTLALGDGNNTAQNYWVNVLSDEIEDLLMQCLELRDKKQCKNCYVEIEKEYKYCPNCGAKQDGEEKKEEYENINLFEENEKAEEQEESSSNLEKTVKIEANVDEENEDIETY